jgi:hypothetical protein
MLIAGADGQQMGGAALGLGAAVGQAALPPVRHAPRTSCAALMQDGASEAIPFRSILR